MIKPLFARVLLQRERAKKIGNIILPDDAQRKHAFTKARVIAVGPSADDSIEVGAEVLIGRYAGDWLNEDGSPGQTEDEYFIVQDEDILAVVS